MIRNKLLPLTRLVSINKWNYICSSLFLIMFLVNIKNNAPLTAIKQILFLSTCMALIFFSSLEKKAPKLSYLILITLTSLGFALYTGRSYFFTDGIIFSAILCLSPFSLEETKYTLKIEYGCIIAIVLNLLFFRINGRATIGGIDPNFSSLLIFLFMSYLYVMRRDPKIILLVALLGLFTLSRTYFVALILFFVGTFIKNRKGVGFLFAAVPLIFLGFLHFFAKTNLETDFPRLYRISENLYYDSGEHTNPLRLLHIVGNRSDNVRAAANEKTIEIMSKDKNVLFFGEHPDTFEQKLGFKSPHNFLLFQIVQSGIFLGLFFIAFVYYRTFQLISPLNGAVVLGFIAYISFLGVEVGSIYFLFYFFILNLIPLNSKLSEKESL